MDLEKDGVEFVNNPGYIFCSKSKEEEYIEQNYEEIADKLLQTINFEEANSWSTQDILKFLK